METNFKIGDKVCNKANLQKAYIILKIDSNNATADCLDDQNKKHVIPLVALQKCDEPGGFTYVETLP